MKKIFCIAFLFVFFVFGTAFADPNISFTTYKCRACDRVFMSFPGDILDKKELKKDSEQLKNIFQFKDPSKNLRECKNGFKAHILDNKGPKTMSLSALVNSSLAEACGILKNGGSLNNMTISEWECVYCKKKFYSINNENLNIRDWENQTDYIKNLKGRAIQRCSSTETLGHIFYQRTTGSVNSLEIAKNADNIYYVRN